jgi:hypothetical protein
MPTIGGSPASASLSDVLEGLLKAGKVRRIPKTSSGCLFLKRLCGNWRKKMAAKRGQRDALLKLN